MRRSAAVVLSGLAIAGTVAAQRRDETSAEVYRRYADRLVKLQVSEAGSGAKSSLGTGFFISADGRLLTNYHVVAEAVADPNYQIEWLDQGGIAEPGRIVAFDVVRDLAVVATDTPRKAFWQLRDVEVAQGTRLYSLGHPEDLGLSIVEGTYNGLLSHTLYPKIHFTAPLNSGMSGGPALTARGEVVGVNVATAGNSLSFLVPIDAAIPLLDRDDDEEPGSDAIVHAIGNQVLANQERYLATLFQGADSSVTIGPFELPTQPTAFFRCWADADRNEDALYEVVDHRCSTDDYIYLSGSQSSGIVSMAHRVLVSRGLNPLRFYSLYSTQLAQDHSGEGFDFADDVTDYRCRNNNVRNHGMVIRTAFCLRRYRKYPGLYDARLKAAVLGARDAGVITQLNLSGVSFPNAEKIARQYLERIRWAKP
jgi:hypothetical protein